MVNVTAFEFLDPHKTLPPAAAVNVIYGDEPFLKRQVLWRLRDDVLGDDSDAVPTTFDGTVTSWRNVVDEVATVSLFGAGRPRFVVVDEADTRGPQGQDSFVTRYRTQLETYVTRPATTGLLVLLVHTWPSNTRLFKSLTETGLQVASRAPQKSGRAKGVDERAVATWIAQWGNARHGLSLTPDATQALLELVGAHFGLLDQELAKLSLFAEAGQSVTDKMVERVTGGWRAKTMWEVLAAAALGETGEALAHLDHLLKSGQHPNALFGQISWSFRRLANAAQRYRPPPRGAAPGAVDQALRDALQQAGVRDWPKGNLQAATSQLKQLGSARAGQLLSWLLEADLALKGSHSTPHRARRVLEVLFLKMSKTARSKPGV